MRKRCRIGRKPVTSNRARTSEWREYCPTMVSRPLLGLEEGDS